MQLAVELLGWAKKVRGRGSSLRGFGERRAESPADQHPAENLFHPEAPPTLGIEQAPNRALADRLGQGLGVSRASVKTEQWSNGAMG